MGRQRLSNVKLDEVSFVGKGDNPEAHIVLLKRKPGEKSEPHRIVKLGKSYSGRDKDRILKEWMDANPDRLKVEKDAMTFDQIIANRAVKDQVWDWIWTLEDSISSIMCDSEVTDKAALIQQSVDEFKAAITPITKKEGGENMSVELKKKLEETEAQVAAVTKERDDLKGEVEALKAKPAAGETCKTCGQKMPDSVSKEEEVLKGLPEDHPIRKELADNRARIAKMEDDNLTREYVSKAAPLVNIGKSEDTGALLKKIAKSDPTLAGEVLALLTTANARIQEGDLLKEKGRTNASVTSGEAIDKLNQMAKEYHDKNPSITLQKAFTVVYDDPNNSDLRKQYNDEMRNRK